MDEMQIFQKKIKKTILKLKNGSASSDEISREFTDAISTYVKTLLEK